MQSQRAGQESVATGGELLQLMPFDLDESGLNHLPTSTAPASEPPALASATLPARRRVGGCVSERAISWFAVSSEQPAHKPISEVVALR